MTILVVEDNTRDREVIVNTINKWKEKNNTDITIYELSKTDASDIQKYRNVDAAILDIEIPGIDGFSFAEYLRNLSSRMEIAFISSHSEYRIRSLKIHCAGFLVKPIQTKAVIELIEFLYKRNVARQNIKETVTFKKYSNYITFHINDILYIKQLPYTHKLIIVTVDGETEFSMNISKAEKLLPKEYFVSQIKGFIVNVTKIRSITQHELKLCNGEKLRVSPKYYDNVVQTMTQQMNIVM